MNSSDQLKKDLEAVRIAFAFYCEEGIRNDTRKLNAVDAAWCRIRDLARKGHEASKADEGTPTGSPSYACETCGKTISESEYDGNAHVCQDCNVRLQDEAYVADECGHPEA